MKKILVLTIACMMVAAFAGCASGTAEKVSSATAEETIQTETTEKETTTAEDTIQTETADKESTTAEETSQAETLVYGTATLTYAEFYSGDVTSTDSYDAVTSATVEKYAIMPNMATDFVDEQTNADGYHITGVMNVNIAIDEGSLDEYQELNPSFAVSEGAPAQYKMATVKDGKVSYSETVYNVVETVTDAEATLLTGSPWGDYQINITETSSAHIRTDRTDEYDINSELMGVILETESGLRVGMEALQSTWVQPYEIAFNILGDNTHNAHISGYDNLAELSKLVGETVVKITYIMPDRTYVYEFEGIYIKPPYAGSITGDAAEGYKEVILSTSDFSAFENGTITATYTVGSGRGATAYTMLAAPLADGTDTYALDTTEVDALEEKAGSYSVVISSDNYADITVDLPASDAQIAALNALVELGNQQLSESGSATLAEHIAEANEMIAENASSSDIASITAELTQLTAVEEEPAKGEGTGHAGG